MVKIFKFYDTRKFYSVFEDKQHTRVPSSSLIPYVIKHSYLQMQAWFNLKMYFGIKSLPYKRAVSAQKCVRAGGKHNDLENVGRTAPHSTFLKCWAIFRLMIISKEKDTVFWEYLTEVLELPKDKLYVTVYIDDDEVFNCAKLPAYLHVE